MVSVPLRKRQGPQHDRAGQEDRSTRACFAPPARLVLAGSSAAQVALGVGEDLDQALQSCLAAGDAVGAQSDLLGQ